MSKKVRGKQKQKLRKQKQSDRRTAGESRRSRVARVAPQSANPDRRGALQQVAELKRHGDWGAGRMRARDNTHRATSRCGSRRTVQTAGSHRRHGVV